MADVAQRKLADVQRQYDGLQAKMEGEYKQHKQSCWHVRHAQRTLPLQQQHAYTQHAPLTPAAIHYPFSCDNCSFPQA